MKSSSRSLAKVSVLALVPVFLLSSKIVGQAKSPADPQDSKYRGSLEVYSDTEEVPDGDGPPRYIHTNYRVSAPDRKWSKWVYNKDEDPEKITLSRGSYIVEAQSEQYGWLRISIAIRTGRTAILHLERKKDWDEDLTFTEKSDLIRLPNGDIVGVYR